MRILVVSVMLLASTLPLTAPAGAATFQVTANDFAWTPAELSVDAGDTVQFLLGSGFHNWVRDDGSDSCSLPCTRTFADTGTVAYHCGIHPSMRGTIVVGTPPAVVVTAPAPGATVGGLVRVEGTASHATDAIGGVVVRIGAGAFVQATLSGGATSVSWSADVPTEALANGAQTLLARATTQGGLVGEISLAVVVDNPPVIDMALVSASAQQNALTTNTLSFVVKNQGNTASGVTVLAEYLYQGTWRTIGTRTLPTVGAGLHGAGSIAWSPGVAAPHVGAFPVRLTADPSATLPDPDRANNARVVTAGWVTSAVPGVVLTEPL